MHYTVITAASEQPLTLQEVKGHLKVEYSDENDLIQLYLDAAVDYAQEWCNRIFVQTEIEVVYPGFSSPGRLLPFGGIALKWGLVDSVTSVKYYASGDTIQTTLETTEYVVINQREPAQIIAATGKSFPGVENRPDAVTVRYMVGYADAAAVPGPIKSAILLLVGEMYERREDRPKSFPQASQFLLSQYKLPYA